MSRLLIAIFFFFSINSCLLAQIGQEFWFAVPHSTPQHADRPVYLRISTYNEAASIKVTVPANGNQEIASFNLAANSFESIDLSSFLNDIECFPFDQIKNRGVFIQSTAEISAYYELFGFASSSNIDGANSEIFTLKGYNALGTNFLVPFQTHWSNYAGIEGYAAFQIVATEDNTTVTITPTNDLGGHPAANGPYQIVLNKGQVYSARAASIAASKRPTGTKITSTKAIAVTFIDDSIVEDQAGAWDTAGDQLMPVNILGTDYAAVKISDAAYNTDWVFICATENNTTLTIGGVLVGTLNAGQTDSFHIVAPTTYIKTSKPAYVFHVAGFGGELGGAILPPLNCNGSKQVQFVRDNNEKFKLTIVVKNGGQGNFKLNNDATRVQASDFTPIPGFTDWWSAYLEFDTDIIKAQVANNLVNSTSDFHLGVVNGSYATGFRYGYFSDLGFLNLGPDRNLCIGQTTRLNAGFGKDYYKWNTGEEGVSQQYITVNTTGTFIVETQKQNCPNISDTVVITLVAPTPLPVFVNPQDTSICQGETYKIYGTPGFKSYEWQDSKKDSIYDVSNSGNYKLTITDQNGCLKSDDLTIEVKSLPDVKISYTGTEETFCNSETMLLSATPGMADYKWSNGESTANIAIVPLADNFYKVLAIAQNGCTGKDSIFVDCSKYIFIPNIFTPNGDNTNDSFVISNKFKANTWNLDVYNRWGKKVYTGHPYNNDWNGDNLEQGIYYYYLSKIDGDAEHKGWVQIMR